MHAVPDALCHRFSERFCYGAKGYSLRQLQAFFSQYAPTVPHANARFPPTKAAYFHSCLYALPPEVQRQALYDLCDDPPEAKGSLPTASERLELLTMLAQADGVSPLGLELSKVSVRGVRNQWFVAASRVATSPSGAVTAARSLVESTCRTILEELGHAPDSSGDLGRLFKQARGALGIDVTPTSPNATHRILNGFTQTIDGLASLSNIGGDRHGLAGGDRIADHSLASMAVHAAGTMSLFLVHVHRERGRTGG